MPARLDFIIIQGKIVAGIEVKNVRPWIYPDSSKYLFDLLKKCCAISAVPVLIARRIHYSTFSVLSRCGASFTRPSISFIHTRKPHSLLKRVGGSFGLPRRSHRKSARRPPYQIPSHELACPPAVLPWPFRAIQGFTLRIFFWKPAIRRIRRSVKTKSLRRA